MTARLETLLSLASLLGAMTCAPLPALRGDESSDLQGLLDRVASLDTNVRYQARFEARKAGATAIPGLGRLMESPPASADASTALEIQRTARNALEQIVHHAAREGAESEAAAVSAVLAKLLRPEASNQVKRDVLHLIAHSGKAESVPAVAALLGDGDAHVRETARLALERIPAPEATAALLVAARSAPVDQRPDLVFSLGKKGDRSVAPAILEMARGGSGKLRLFALEALARLEAVEAIPLFESILDDTSQPDLGKVAGEYLRLASALE